MLDGEDEKVVTPLEVEVRIAPGMKLRRSTERLSATDVEAPLSSVMDEHDGDLELALEAAEESEELGHTGRRVLVHPVEADERIEDETGKVRKLMIEDWEIGALYWNSLARTGGNDQEALRLVRQKYEEEFLTKCDVTLFLGTTLAFHAKNAPNPFVIIGVFYPRRRDQLKLEF